jgi:high-affinity K+ transport system ATPase subunit B
LFCFEEISDRYILRSLVDFKPHCFSHQPRLFLTYFGTIVTGVCTVVIDFCTVITEFCTAALFDSITALNILNHLQTAQYLLMFF